MSSLKPIISHIPHAPGVYRFLDGAGVVIYVGKAIDLKKRVSSYFRNEMGRSQRLVKLVESIEGIEYTVVDSELEALILETNLIKAVRPKYNVLMKDDKSYVYLKITVNEPLPRILIVRKVERDGARYFGPRTSASSLRRVLDSLKKVFPYRHCQLFIQLKEKKILNHADHKKRCFGTCVLSADPIVYRAVIEQVICFFEGKTEQLELSLKDEMAWAVKNRQFEQAALLRDRLQAIMGMFDTQRVSAPDAMNRDVIGVSLEGGDAYVTLFMFRDGKLVTQENFVLNAVDAKSGAEIEEAEVVSAFLQQYYECASDFPRELLLPCELEKAELFSEWLFVLSNHLVSVLSPQRGKNRSLIELARDNAKSFARQAQVRWQAGEGQDVDATLQSLKDLLNLPKLPKRIECYDISHLGGTDTVGSMVVFEKGFSQKFDYRHFKLRTVQERIDDYQAMGEVLRRRFRYLKVVPSFFRKPRKKDLNDIEKMCAKKGLNYPTDGSVKWLIAEKGKKIVGMACLRMSDESTAELVCAWVEPSQSDDLKYELIFWLMKRQKRGKIYTMIPRDLTDWYVGMGFHEAVEVPSEFVVGDGFVLMVYRAQKVVVDNSFAKKPDLLVIDGGKGQLKEAVQALKEAGLSIPVISLAKRLEEIFVPGQSRSLILPHESGELQLLQRLRDEAHRFALKYQRDLRGKRLVG